MLPTKKELKSLRLENNISIPKRYLNSTSEYFIKPVVKSIKKNKILCLCWYSVNGELLYVNYFNKEFDIITFVLSTKKWLKSSFRNLSFFKMTYKNYEFVYNFEFLNSEIIFNFYNTSKNDSVVSFLTDRNDKRKEELKYQNTVSNAIVRCREKNAFFDNLDPLPRGVKSWAKNSVIGYEAFFNISNRHKAYCSRCGTTFSVNEELKHGHNITCPHCRAKLKICSYKKRGSHMEKGFQVIGNMNDSIVVRHFLISRKYDNDCRSVFNFFEYERDLMTPDSSEYNYMYYINTYNTYANTYYWRNKKTFSYYNFASCCPKKYFMYEKIYPNNLHILNGTKYANSGIGCIIDTEFRAEDYLSSYIRKPYMEQLVKDGFVELAMSCISDKLNDVMSVNGNYSLSSIFGLPKDWINYIKNNKLEVRDVNILKYFYNHNFTIDNYIEVFNYCSMFFTNQFYYVNHLCDDMKDVVDFYLKHKKILKVSLHKFCKYLTRQRQRLYYYTDYFKMYGSVIENDWNKNALFPKDLEKAHNRASREYKAKKDELISKQLIQLYKKCFQNIDKTIIENFEFIFPQKIKDFIDEGKNNCNCVSSYATKTIDNQGVVVVFMRKKEDIYKSYITCEYIIKDNDIRLNQCFRKGNTSADKSEEKIALKLAPMILKNYKTA